MLTIGDEPRVDELSLALNYILTVIGMFMLHCSIA